MAISWNQKQREIFDLLSQGKKFSEIVEQGYARSTVSSIMHAFEKGEKPPEPESKPGPTAPMAAVKLPSAGVTQFEIGQAKIPIYPEDMLQCYDQYRDMQVELGWESDFSSTLREGMKLLRTVVVNFTPQEKEAV